MRGYAKISFTLIISLCLLLSTGVWAQECLDYAAFPTTLGQEAGPVGPIGEIAQAGDAIYAVSGNNLLIYTLDNPLTPMRAVTMDIGANLQAPRVSGDLLIFGVDDEGLRIYDISNRTAPVLVNSIPRTGTSTYTQMVTYAIEGDLLVYTDYLQPVTLLDISNPALPVVLSTIETTISGIALEGDQMAFTGGTFQLYDISNPATPIQTVNLYDQSGCAWSIYSFGDPVFHDGFAYAEHKFACNWRNPYLYGDPITVHYSLTVVSADKQAQPDLPMADKILGGSPARNAMLAGDRLLFAADPGFHDLYDLTIPGSPVAGYYPLIQEIYGLCEVAGLLYAATDIGLVVTDVPGSYSEDYFLGDNGDVGSRQFKLQTTDNLLFQGATSITLWDTGAGYYETLLNHVIRVWSGSTYLGDFNLNNYYFYDYITWNDLILVGSHAYFGSKNGLFIKDLNTLVPSDVASDFSVPAFLRMADVNDMVYLLDQASGAVRILSPVDPMNPTDLGLFLDTAVYSDMVINGDILYLREANILRQVDTSIPDAPVIVSPSLIIPDGTLKMDGDYLFITSETQITWYDTSSGFPMQMGSIATDREYFDVVVSGNNFYFADGLGVGLADLTTGDFLGRVMAKATKTLAFQGNTLMGGQDTQWDPFFVPVDCSDVIPVFLMANEIQWDQGVGTMSWEISGSATASDFHVEARCDNQIEAAVVQQVETGSFMAQAPEAFSGEITFDLYLETGTSRILLSTQTLSPIARPMLTELAGINPNPFNPQTEISFRVSVAGQVKISVYDLTGRRISILADGPHAPGDYTATWQGRDSQGRAMASGSYVVRLESASGNDSRKLLLVR